MPKRTIPTSYPPIALDSNSAQPLYKQLYERLRSAMVSGQLERGARLPSTRTLASELGVSRNTTALAYELLLLEGYIEGRVGHGTTVAHQLPMPLAQAALPDAVPPSSAPLLATRLAPLRQVMSPAYITTPEVVTFRGGEPALDQFPSAIWARLLARHARQSLRSHAYYGDGAGYYPLREAIAAHIGITRGVRCTPDQILLTAGSQGALDLAARTLLSPGDAAWIENPGYFGAQGVLFAAGARLVPVPVDEEGLNVAIGQQRCPTARVVSVTPSHQFPTGVTMSLGRRLALLEWAKAAEAWIWEDDYDSEYRFGGRPLEALQGLDQDARVLYIGTFSKTLFPALRLGYLVAPVALIEPLLTVRRFIDTHVPLLEQMALTDFIREGHFARHLRHMRQCYQRRRDRLQQALHTHLGDLLEVYAPEVGMHLVGWLPPGKDDQHAARLAAQAGFTLLPISKTSLEPLARGGLLFGYAGTHEAEIEPAVQRLAAALDNL